MHTTPVAQKPAPTPDTPVRRMAAYASAVLVYTLLVILFGAVVRITGSGAGCGQHWPTCNGEITHLPRHVETAIELSHRISSGLSFLLVLALAVACYRSFPRRHLVRRSALFSVVCMVVEVLIGAALVLSRLVGDNASGARAIVMTAHLVNTCLLTASLAVLAWASRFRQLFELRFAPGLRWRWGLGALGVLLVCVTGAVTALGDTLYPVNGALAATTGKQSHFLQDLRVYHPAIAILVGLYLVRLALHFGALEPRALLPEPTSSSVSARWLLALVVLQLACGVANVYLAAPGFMQVLHLASALCVWLCLIWLGLSVCEQVNPSGEAARLPPRAVPTPAS